jgi:hypothetical protein
VLNQSMFTHNEYVIAYGLKVAKFIIVDESYASGDALASVNRMVCVIQTFDSSGVLLREVFGCLVIGLGDTGVAVSSTDTTLLGKLLSKDNMDKCSVELYE